MIYCVLNIQTIPTNVLQEQPFVGSLVSVFPDGSQREREVEAVFQVQRYKKERLYFVIRLFPLHSVAILAHIETERLLSHALSDSLLRIQKVLLALLLTKVFAVLYFLFSGVDLKNNIFYPARALRALGLLLADSAHTVHT